jgi:ribonucleoside-triphosphate reductase
MRYCALQNVSLNLPRIAYMAKGDDTRLFDLLTDRFVLAVKPTKRRGHSLKTPALVRMAVITFDHETDDMPYFRFDLASHLIGMVVLNEKVRYIPGKTPFIYTGIKIWA